MVVIEVKDELKTKGQKDFLRKLKSAGFLQAGNIIVQSPEVVHSTLQYEVWTRDKYISYLCCNGSDLNNSIKTWNEVNKGYNFVIAIKGEKGYMIYSVDYFNDYIAK